MPLDYVTGEMPGAQANKGTAMFVWDRRRSISARTGPGDVEVAKYLKEPPVPFHRDGHRMMTQLIRRVGLHGQILFMWAKRVGDCLELEYVLIFFPSAEVLIVILVA